MAPTSPPASLTDALLAPALGPAAARPLLTWYDDATAERFELSGTTTANWVAKTANLLRDECEVTGEKVAVVLPAHWQTAAVVLAIWACGAELVSDPGNAHWVFTDADHLGGILRLKPDGVVALSLDAFGTGVPGLPRDVLDYAMEIRLHGDEFVLGETLDGDVVAWDGLSIDQVLSAARGAATTLGFTAGDRVLSTRDWSSPEGLREGLVAVLAAGASLVQVVNPDPSALERTWETERCTRRLQ